MQDAAATQPDPPDRTGPRLLLIRPTALGDVAKTAASLAALRRAHPHAHIDWLVSRPFAPLIAPHPALDGVVAFDRKRAGSWAPLLRTLYRARYDAVYDLQGLLRSGLFTLATRAKVRIGFADAREGAAWCYNRKHAVTIDQNAVDRMLGLLSADGIDTAAPDPRLYVDPDEQQPHRDWLAEHGLDPNGYVAVAPTAKWGCKRWPIERFRVLLRRLTSAGHPAVVIAGPGEADSVRLLVGAGSGASGASGVSRASGGGGVLFEGGVGRLSACLADARAVVANDSAALHIAVGHGRPVVGLYGPTDPKRVGPYQRPEAVVQPDGLEPGEMVGYRKRQDDDALIRRISVDAVWERLRAVAGV
ncbi:MAG: glycosyltransferase family 9 protein [Planctomycetota bacterium]